MAQIKRKGVSYHCRFTNDEKRGRYQVMRGNKVLSRHFSMGAAYYELRQRLNGTFVEAKAEAN